MSKRRKALWIALALLLVAVLTLGCRGAGEEAPGSQPAGGEAEGASADLPSKDPAQPFALGEKGAVTLANDQAYDLTVQRENGEPLFVMSMKKSAVIDPQVSFAIQTYEMALPEELAESYVAVGQYALEMHVIGDTGYGFALRPKLLISYTEGEIEDAGLDTVSGNLVVLYKEQRAPKWVPQTSLGIDEATGTVSVSNIAGAGAWRLVAKKAP